MFAGFRRFAERWREHRAADAAARSNRDRGTHCYYCDVVFSDTVGCDRTIDHRIPRSHGGTDALVNMVFACRACNERKADRDEASFVESDWLAERRRSLTDGDDAH